MPNGSALNFWLPINKQTWESQVNDLLSNGLVEVPCGCAIQFNLAFFSSGNPFNSGSTTFLNIASLYSQIVFQILKSDLSAVLVTQTIASANFGSATAAQFAAFTNAQVQIFIPSASNLLSTQSGGQGNFILQVYGVDSDGAGDIDMLGMFQINALATGISAGSNAILSSASTTRGATAIAAGASSGTIAFAPGLAYVPAMVILTVQAPDTNGENLVATITGAPTAVSFTFNLSASTDRAGYVLHWLALQ